VYISDYPYTGLPFVYLIYDYRLPIAVDLCYSDYNPEEACCQCAAITTTSTTTTTTLSYSTFVLYLKTDEGTGWDQENDACQAFGSLFFLFGDPGYTTLQEFFADGKRFYSNTGLDNIYNGQNKWFKTSGQPNQGNTIQIGPDGFINTIGSNC
jgi:hypothetical protein